MVWCDTLRRPTMRVETNAVVGAYISLDPVALKLSAFCCGRRTPGVDHQGRATHDASIVVNTRPRTTSTCIENKCVRSRRNGHQVERHAPSEQPKESVCERPHAVNSIAARGRQIASARQLRIYRVPPSVICRPPTICSSFSAIGAASCI